MKKSLITTLILSGLLPATGALAAEDYTQYSTPDLLQMGDEVRYMSEADRDAYRSERQSRMQSMSQEERQTMRSEMGTSSGGYRNMAGAEQGQGSMTRSRLRDGSGDGGGQRRGGGFGGGGGRGRR
ncbi:hypothetical protein QQ73_03825 [Candidatus Endoriftia persephone str. Guaymas]|jgi:hypothetical protein|uniref:Secreted protein n=2 Tax=Gammaproteobacteria TaxID=1236 RepID=G2FIJ0_9GAMM|nr:hypothetical protein [Candidatus Endoriftia persephone]EGW53380.1 hypothetical protein TevJSym_bd00160 [endosymbiont of Tevnia jerichonana (vent Tica)]MBA1330327.1 hypothetical protein [Candidatus Endoriftia persephone str. Guaymas]USF87116.1 hypothetical protein L0Y14_13370 [Candidatus Endoriftia persephone]